MSSGINVTFLKEENNIHNQVERLSEERQSTREHWERIYRQVTRHYQLYRAQPQLLEILRGLAERVPTGRLLEVGCGKGNELIECAKLGLHCVGIDYSEQALSLLRQRLSSDGPEVTLLQADARSLPFVENSFDIVFSQGVLEHFRDPRAVLDEQRRVLRPGGFIVVEVPNKWTAYTIYKKMLMAINRWAPGWETQYSPRELRQLLESRGFRVIDIVGWDFLTLKIYRKMRRLSGKQDSPESTFGERLRHCLQRNTILLYLFASITIVGMKR